MKGASFKTAIESNTPIGIAIKEMLSKSVDGMHGSWRATKGNGPDAAAPAAGSAVPQ